MRPKTDRNQNSIRRLYLHTTCTGAFHGNSLRRHRNDVSSSNLQNQQLPTTRPTIELDLEKIPTQVVSNIGCYRNVARVGQQMKVAGHLKKPKTSKDRHSLLPSRCWNSHVRRRVHMATLKLRDRDAIQTAEGLIFRVFGYSHPQNALHLRCRIRQFKHLPIKRSSCTKNRQKRTLLQILQ